MHRVLHVLWPLVMMVSPPRQHPLWLGVLGSGLVSTSELGGDASGALGGGLVVSWGLYGPYPSEPVWFALDLRARLVDDLSVPGGRATLPIDLLARVSLVPSYSFRDMPCRTHSSDPNAICMGYAREEPFPVQPYVALGGSVVVPISPGDTRGGPVLALGVEWFVTEQLALLVELEGRALFGGPNVAGQAALNVGFLVGP